MKKILMILIAVLAGSMAASAEQDSTVVSPAAEKKHQRLTRQERRARLDSMLTARYYKSPYDSNYVVRPEGKLTLKLRLNQTGNDFTAKGTVDGVYQKADLSTSHKTTLSVGASYRGISLALAVNPAKWKGVYKDYELNLNYFSSRISLDFSYQQSKSLQGDIDSDEGTLRIEADDVDLKVLTLAGYYTFNHRHFSFPAAFTQSYIQKRSAGSWLAGFSYQAGSLKTTDDLAARMPESSELRYYVGHFGIGGGYGYNLVLGRKWLFHLSVMPTFVIFNRNNITVDGERIRAGHVGLNMIFNERAAIVYNFSPRYFAGATLVVNNSYYDDDDVVINQNKWRARFCLGMRL